MTSQILAGVDEVGRGCLAGPVISAAIILNNLMDKSILKDSKALTEKKRTYLASYILNNCISVGIGVSSNNEIDQLNIHNATLLSMKRAVHNLVKTPTKLVVDGLYKPDTKINTTCVVKGDQLLPEISAASIIAKVLRDNVMKNLDKQTKVYGFSQHKGYGTKQHLLAIDMFGPSIYHRMSFAPLKTEI